MAVAVQEERDAERVADEDHVAVGACVAVGVTEEQVRERERTDGDGVWEGVAEGVRVVGVRVAVVLRDTVCVQELLWAPVHDVVGLPEGVGLLERLPVTLGLDVGLGEGLRLGEEVEERDAETEAEREIVRVKVCVGAADSVWVADNDQEGEELSIWEGDPDGEREAEGEGAEAESEAEGEAEGVAEGVGVRLCSGVPLGLTERLREALGDGVDVGLQENVAVWEWVRLPVSVWDGDGERERLAVGLPEGDLVADSEGVPVGECVGVALGLSLRVDVGVKLVQLRLAVGDVVPFRLPLQVWLAVGEGTEAEAEADCVGLTLMLAGVRVGVYVLEYEGVSDGVGLSAEEAVAVGEQVVGVGRVGLAVAVGVKVLVQVAVRVCEAQGVRVRVQVAEGEMVCVLTVGLEE